MLKILALTLTALLLGACGSVATRIARQVVSLAVVAETAPLEATEAPAVGDPARGKALFTEVRGGVTCSGCHLVDSDARLVGPGLLTVGERAKTRVEGMPAQAYLRESIVNPSAVVVAGYYNMMPGSFADLFTEQEINDLVAYLMSLDG
ncbi:MAG: c-type cytochrome [Chloroflexota bacterium]